MSKCWQCDKEIEDNEPIYTIEITVGTGQEPNGVIIDSEKQCESCFKQNH